jgi:glutathione synthase/RimK-type ligase-like ATP-grasp enzyme
MMILAVSSEQDAHLQAVRHSLEQMGAPLTVVDLAEFPQQAQVTLNFSLQQGCHESILSDYQRELNLSDCPVVWWRQPRPFLLHPELTDQHYRSFAYIECQATIAGLWLALDAFWVNHPMRSEEAQRKPYQLKVAQQVGFSIPATLITNNPMRARSFVERHGADRTVYRAFSATAHSWHEARLLPSQPMTLLDNVCYAPVIFQEYIPAYNDLYVVGVGNDLFAAVAPALCGDKVDTVGELEPYPLNPALTDQVRTLMARLGLVYGVVHMRIAQDGQPIFIEIDPAGAWLQIEEQTGLPITQALARLLTRQVQHRRVVNPAAMVHAGLMRDE